VNVDTGQFQALTERVDQLERMLDGIDKASWIVARAHEAEYQETLSRVRHAERARHLTVVE
jgi:hypothetical protein